MLLKNLLVGLTGSHFVDGQGFTFLVAKHESICQKELVFDFLVLSEKGEKCVTYGVGFFYFTVNSTQQKCFLKSFTSHAHLELKCY